MEPSSWTPTASTWATRCPSCAARRTTPRSTVSDYQRIESVTKSGDKLRVPDLTSHPVWKAIEDAGDAKHLYQSAHATDY